MKRGLTLEEAQRCGSTHVTGLGGILSCSWCKKPTSRDARERHIKEGRGTGAGWHLGPSGWLWLCDDCADHFNLVMAVIGA